MALQETAAPPVGRAARPGPDPRPDAARPVTLHDGEALRSPVGRIVRALPGFLVTVAGLAWRCSPGATLAVAGLQVVSSVAATLGLLGVASLLAGVLASGEIAARLAGALPGLAAVAGCYAVAGLAAAGLNAAQARLSPGVRRLAEDDLVVAAADAELVSFDDPAFHDALVRACDRGVRSLDQAVMQLVQLGAAGVSLLTMGAVVAALHPLMLLALVASVVPSAWATVRSARLGYGMVLATVPLRRRVAQFRDLLTEREPAAEVRAFTAQPFLLGEYRAVAAELERTEVGSGRRQAGVEFAGRSLAALSTAAAFGLLVWLVLAGWVAVAAAGATVLAMQSGRAALSRAAVVTNQLYEHSLYVADFDAFRRRVRARRRPVPTVVDPGGPEVVTARSVSFRYPGSATDALSGIDLTVARGQVIALVGENGSGKTTLAKLLAGLYTPRTGAIRWDGVDLAAVDPESVRARIALIPQHATRWPLTAEQNVRLGLPAERGPDPERLAEAVAAGGADDVIARLPGGWTTVLSTEFAGGTELSTGQWQRLAIARAFYRDASLLICDEPTAPLDARAEARVGDALRRLAGGRTVVLITHRMDSVRDADQIVVLHRGRIAERGTHDTLMARGGRYADLRALQRRPSACG